ncbi:MAG: hypothetical protein KIT24_06145 [Phycisphaeraceae bacterium]|nr:hypothetical protein [Phycisphaeraceae bacterium]
MSEPITLAHSPDADDMVMWWPLCGMRDARGNPIEGDLGRPSIDTEGLTFCGIADDVQRLNRRAIDTGDYDVTAVSAHAYPYIADRYAVTSCGASFGEGYGPKVVVRAYSTADDLSSLPVSDTQPLAIPGRHTTAFLALRILAGWDMPVCEMLFSRIPEAVATGECGAGLLIHEAQLTFAALGLRQVADMGAQWQARTGLALPLGLNVIRRDLDVRHGRGTIGRVVRLLDRSIRYAVERADLSHQFLLLHADRRPEWRDADLVHRYLSMYVSPMTLDMGEAGREAIKRLLGEGYGLGLSPDPGSIDVLWP